MSDRFYICSGTTASNCALEIDVDRYLRIVGARKTLVDALSFEQRYDLLLSNYMAFESWAATHSIGAKVFFDHSYEAGLAAFGEANRHVMNLLSSARSFVDQLKQDFGHLPLSPAFADQATKKIRESYGECDSYRFLDALRNYVQHYALPVHMIDRAEGEGSSGGRADVISCFCLREILAQDGGFKEKVLDEMGEKADLRIAFRYYISALSRIHIRLRILVSGHVNSARETIANALDDFAEHNGERLSAVLVAKEDAHGKRTGTTSVLLKWDDARVNLTRKNRMPALMDV